LFIIKKNCEKIMKYKPLRSLYYQNKDEYKNEYEKRVNSPATVFFDIKINGNMGFIVADWEVVSLIETIGRNNAEAAEIFCALPGVAQEYYKRKCLIDEIQTTNDIEGIHSTRKEIKDALGADETGKRLTRFQGIAKKYEKLLQTSPQNLPLKTCADIRNLYDEIVSREIDPDEQPDGIIFRNKTVFVFSPTQQKRHEGVNPEKKIIETMEEALRILEARDLPILIRIAVFHYFFGFIHPFYDGNGRMSRFISSYLLKENSFPLLALDLSHTIKEHKKAYYDAFRICNDKKNMGDVTPFAITFLEFLEMSSARMKENLREGAHRLERLREVIDKKLGKDDKQRERKGKLLFLLLQNALFALEPFSMQELQHYMGCSRTTLEKLISALTDEGFPVITDKKTRPHGYTLDPDRLDEALEEG